MFPKLQNGFFLKIKPNKYELCNPIKLPDSNLNINATAFDIFSLCNGKNNINDIIGALFNKYNETEKNLENYVLSFLKESEKNGLLTYSEKISFDSQNYIKGHSEIYYPDVISWEITNFCPLNCVHCYLKEKNNKSLGIEEIDKIIKIISTCGIRMIQVTGGDPLTHPNLEYILKKLMDMKIPVVLLTSGVKYNEETLKVLSILKTVPNSAVRVSLDGTEQNHNIIRKNPNAFINTVTFIKKLREIGVPCQVATTAMSQNEAELESLVAFTKSLGVYYMEIGQLINEGNADKNNLNPIHNGKSLSVVLNKLSEKYSDNTFQIKKYFERPEGVVKKCGAGTQIIYISSDLDIKPCPVMSLKLGNLREESFEKIMTKSGNLFDKIISPDTSVCSGCKFESDCNGCSAQAISKNKFLKKKCEWYEKYQPCFSNVHSC